MRAGKLRHYVIIQSILEELQDDYGGATKTWQTHATVWASIDPLRGQEAMVAKQTQSSANYRIRVRHCVGLTPHMRVLWGTRIFNIVEVLNTNERNFQMELMAQEIV